MCCAPTPRTRRWSFPPLPPLDALVYGDVLEHLREPWAVLARHVPLLSDDGLLIACIPNVQHWSVLEQLLHGRWPLAEEGIFDRTHLRWFTRAGIAEHMAGCGLHLLGLHLLGLHPRVFQIEQAEAFVSRLAPALPAMGLNPQTLLSGVAPLQYVVTASRRPHQKLQLDGLTLKPQAGMVEVRMRQPLAAVASRGGIGLRLRSENLELLRPDPALPRLLIWQRPLLHDPAHLEQLRQLLNNNYVVIVEYDDDPDHWPAIAANNHLTFTGVHAVQASTEPIAEAVRRYNPEVAVFGNALEALPTPRPAPAAGQPLRLFFGALNREADWAPWMEALNTVLLETPGRWQVEVVHDRALFAALALPQRRFTPTCDYPTYRQRLAGCDIAFLPLADTPFNRCKSDLKAVEATGAMIRQRCTPWASGGGNGWPPAACSTTRRPRGKCGIGASGSGARSSMSSCSDGCRSCGPQAPGGRSTPLKTGVGQTPPPPLSPSWWSSSRQAPCGSHGSRSGHSTARTAPRASASSSSWANSSAAAAGCSSR
jgi:hypothetical protein